MSCREDLDLAGKLSRVPMAEWRILVADDQEAIRKRVCSILLSRSTFQVCGEAENGKEVVEKTKELNPDVIILDITMPVMNGLDAARMIRKVSTAPIVILSVHKSKQLMEEAQKIGARGYVAKADAGHDLLRAVDTVLENGTFFPPEV